MRIFNNLVLGTLNEVRHDFLTSKPFHDAQRTLKTQSNDASRMIQKKCLVYIVQGGVDKSP